MFAEHPITGLFFYRFFCFDFENQRYPGFFHIGEDPSVCIKPHTQPDMELLWIESGTFYMEVNSRRITAEAGDLLVINPEDAHSGTVPLSQSRAAYHCIKIGIETLASCPNEVLRQYAAFLSGEELKIRNLIPAQTVAETGIGAILPDLIQCGARRDDLSSVATLGNVCLLLSVLLSRPLLQQTPVLLSTDQKGREFERRLLSYLEQNWNRPITSRHAAKAFSYSQEYFCKVFKENMGEPFSRYLLKWKMHKAKELFESGKSPWEVMNEVGMNNYSYFYRSFRKFYGVSPMKCRQKKNR